MDFNRGAAANMSMNETSLGYASTNGEVVISLEDQERLRDKEQIRCLRKMLFGPHLNRDLYCNSTWDKITCWPDTLPNTTVYIQCANYINGFYVNNFASRRCMPDGQWYINPLLNRTWTNYSQCYNKRIITNEARVGTLLETHMEHIRLMFNIGYGLSFATLTVAVFIMIYFKRLHCPRNTVHLNLFIAFMLRALLSLLKENLLVQGLGLPSDVEQTPYQTVIFIEEGPHWECKMLFTIFYYVLMASYMWIFVEGLHLHTLIMVSVFSERSSVKWYLCIGWAVPLLFIIPWVVIRVLLENVYCWNTNPSPGYMWILKGPVVLVTVINFIFFMNILRALFTKMKTPISKTAKKHKYRRLAKSTLVLIPLFGVHYVVFLGLPDQNVEPQAEVIKLYFEMFLNSFQGLLVATLFCFMNNEVQMEIMKRLCNRGPYYRYRQYYRQSSQGGSYRCVCQKNNQSQNGYKFDSARRSSGDNSSTLLLNSTKYPQDSCFCRWHVDSRGHLCRHFVKHDDSLKRVQSCL
ncbi:secretin receptor-like isoform X2 [Ostrea edulis]|uniref:secretin receptor-like isoform X2 n=1 Tax=Ostrea edulis TaxID=37623 RepID=UPI0020963057|nr:secretin receptor-like isoform X2 [Ostrea edulis]